MKNFFSILIGSLSIAGILYAQQIPDFVGKHIISGQLNGINQVEYITVPELNNNAQVPIDLGNTSYNDFLTGTSVRWSYQDPVSIGDRCAVSGNGLYGAVGWGLNNPRISFYGNNNSTPLWEYPVVNNSQVNFVSLNYAGDLIAAGASINVYVFNNSSNVPIFNFDLTPLGATASAGPVALAQNENFLVATSTFGDSSIIFGFNTASTTPVWQATIIDPAGGSGNILGVKLSGNDSLMIVNTYAHFWVMETFTGNIIYDDVINPLSAGSGTQATQGINIDGSIIATVNYYGYVRVFQRSGSTYNLMWQDQEPPGTFYNWANCVDVSNDGNYVAVGTLIFVSSTAFNGTVKLYKTSQGAPPQWVYNNCGDNVSSVSFNAAGNVLVAAAWGAMDNSTPDFWAFKTWEGNLPVFTVNTAGSFFDGKISADGTSALTSGKAVHARTFGSGGLAYNISVDTSDSNVPVELTSFAARSNGRNVNLVWSTASEINNRGFVIERKSEDGQYQQIAFVDGHGTTVLNNDYSFIDKSLANGKYFYRLKQMDFNGSYEYSFEVQTNVSAPVIYSLQQNFPNPFNPSTIISFSLSSESKVTLKVFNVLGQEVSNLIDGNMTAGLHSINFNASQINSGVYFYKLEAKGIDGSSYSSVKKMILTK